MVHVNEVGEHSELTSYIELLPDRDAVYTVRGLYMFGVENVPGNYEITTVRAPEFKAKSLTAGDILRSIPSVSTDNEHTVGILLPPFGYFVKKF